MAVIAIPVGNASDFGSAFRAAFRALTFSAPDALAREPFFTVATREDGWGSDSFDQLLSDRGLLLLSEAPLAERIHDGINAIDAQRLRAHYENREVAADTSSTAADLRTPTVIVPVLRVSNPGDVARLAEIAAAVDAALEPLSTRLVRRELSSSAFAFVPWIHIEPPLSRDRPPAGLFVGPQRIRGGKAVPVLNVSVAASQWQDRGRIRLIADLLALYGFSRRRDAAAWLSPADWAESDAFHTFVTSFVELPILRTRRRHVLKQLQENLLATKESPPAELQKRAEESMQSLNTLINMEDVPIEAFILDGNPLGVDVDVIPDPQDFASTNGNQKAGVLHNKTIVAVRAGVADRMKDAANQALTEFRTQLRNDEIALENGISSVLGDTSSNPSIGDAVEAATRFADLLVLALPKPAVATSGMDVEQLVQQVNGRRGGWLADDAALWQQGSRLPSRAAIAMSTLLILFGSSILALLTLEILRRTNAHPAFVVLAPLLVALAPPALYAWFRIQFIHDYFEEWKRFADRLRGEIAGVARQLHDIANRRLKALKMGSLPALERAIHAVKIRIRTEHAGLLSLIRKELETAGDEEAARPSDGWFRLPTSAVEAKITQQAPTELRALLLSIVTLKDWPRPLQLSTHFDALDRAVKTVTSSEHEDFAAAGNLIRAVVEYAKDPRVSLDLDDDRAFTSLRRPALYAFSPNDLRAAVAQELGTGTAVDPYVPELVVVSNVQSHHVIRHEEERHEEETATDSEEQES